MQPSCPFLFGDNAKPFKNIAFANLPSRLCCIVSRISFDSVQKLSMTTAKNRTGPLPAHKQMSLMCFSRLAKVSKFRLCHFNLSRIQLFSLWETENSVENPRSGDVKVTAEASRIKVKTKVCGHQTWDQIDVVITAFAQLSTCVGF